MFTKLAQIQGTYTITVDLGINLDDSIIRLTTVYGPTSQQNRTTFYDELKRAKPIDIPWLVAGDFNVTLHPTDRSNQGHRQHEMRQFQAEVHALELIDLLLQGRRYTWSNERENPSHVRLDRFLISLEWAHQYPNSTQKALPNSASDHCPLLCTCQTKFPCPNVFRVENYWLKMTDFKELVTSYWNEQQMAQYPLQLHKKIVGLRKRIIQWKKGKSTLWKEQMTNCLDCLQWLEVQQEQRPLNEIERMLRPMFKARFRELAQQEEMRWKQRAKKDWVVMGDKNTKYFHHIASHHKRKNQIDMIEDQGRAQYEHEQKAQIIHNYFCQLMGKQHRQSVQFNLSNIIPARQELMHDIQG